MKETKPGSQTHTTTEAFEERVADRSHERYVLCLYIAGLTPRSTLAIERIRDICDRYLAGRSIANQLSRMITESHPAAAPLLPPASKS